MLAVGVGALIAPIVPVTTVLTAHAAPSSDTAGAWKGQYVCQQGVTGLTLTIADSDQGALTATFHFYAVPSNPGVPDGSFEMRGSYSPPHVALNGTRWIDQPANYGMVAIDATLIPGDPDRISGIIPGAGCGSVELVRMSSKAGGPVVSSTRCDLTAVAGGVGGLLVCPAAVVGVVLVLFLLFGSSGLKVDLVTFVRFPSLWMRGVR